MLLGKKVGALVLVLLIISFVELPCWASEPIKIAFFDPLSGPFKRTGDNYVAAFEFLAEEINESGGLLGRKVEFIAEDSQFKPDIALRKARKQILDGVKIIGTGTGTHISRALQELAEKEKVLFFIYGTEGDEITGKFCNSYTFRTSPNTDMRSMAIANFLATKPYRKFYTITMDYAFGHDAAKGFIRRVQQVMPDAKILGEDYHPISNKDFGPYISKIIAAKPDVIFTSNWDIDLLNLMKQARDMGVKAPFICYYLNDPAQTLPAVKEGAIGSWACEAYMETVRTAANKDFLQRWSKKPNLVAFEKWPAIHIGKAYNGAKFMIEAIKRAGSMDVPKIIKTWEGMKWESVIGPVIMRAEDHQIMMPIPIAEIIPPTNEFYAFPYVGEPYMVPIEKTTIPLNETGCKREKGEL